MGVSGVWQVPKIARDKLLAVVGWREGGVKVGEPVDQTIPDVVLRTFGAAGEGVARFAEMVIPLEPVLQKFLGTDGCEPPVQTFRYRGHDGVLRRALWCGDCGHFMICEMGELQRMVRVQCRKCNAGISPEICEAWHAFGRCSCCNGAAAGVE